MAVEAAHAAEILNKDFNGANYTPPATWYLGFLSGGVELSGGGYARIAITANTTNFPTTATGEITNGTTVSTPTATADWNTADEVGLWDASSGGNRKYRNALDEPFTLLINQGKDFEPGDLRIALI